MSRLETVLVAYNDMNIRYFLKRRLSYLGYTVIIAANGQEVLSLFAKKQPDLVILDIMISKLDGYKVCKILRKNSRIPIILLTALANTTDHIRGLDLGADEYLTKPFLPEELETRIRSLLIRSYKIDYFNPLILQIGDLKLNTIKRHVLKDNKPVHLTLVEYNLLKLLMNKAGDVLHIAMSILEL